MDVLLLQHFYNAAGLQKGTSLCSVFRIQKDVPQPLRLLEHLYFNALMPAQFPSPLHHTGGNALPLLPGQPLIRRVRNQSKPSVGVIIPIQSAY